jgi:hypothetical protein
MKPRVYLSWLLAIILGSISTVTSTNYIVDPYHFNNLTSLNLDDDIALRRNYRLYKMTQFLSHPKPRIILGDSRGDSLSERLFFEEGLNDIYNFSYGGATFTDILDTFWFAERHVSLKTVVIELPFNIYSATSVSTFTSEAEEAIRQPILYYMNPSVFRTSTLQLYSHFTGVPLQIEKPLQSREDFWLFQLNETTRGFYGNWVFPERLLEKLHAIASYCQSKSIRLVFVIPPTHVELQRQVQVYGLNEQYTNYKHNLGKLGQVLDYDYKSELTTERANFRDPYHFTPAVAKTIVQNIVALIQGRDFTAIAKTPSNSL